MKTIILKAIFLLSIMVFVGGVAKDASALSYAACPFYRDLTVGSRGEDVRCLQQYLQSAGYGSTFSSYGTPDGIFGQLTRQAVMQWQQSCGLPAHGYFDANSQAKYLSMSCGNYYGGGTVLGASTCVPAYDPRNGHLITDCGNSYGNNYDDMTAWNKIEKALIMIEDAKDAIDDSHKNTTKAENKLDDAKDDIIDAVHSYFVDRDFSEAFDRAEDAYDNAEDAYDEVDGGNSGSKTDAKNAIEDAKDAIDDARDEIQDADDDGDDVDEAWDILNEAEDKLDDAEDEYDDKDYNHAEDLADDARELADDAVDAINY